MLRIGICDDECYARDALRLELEKLLEETEEIVYEFSGGETAVSWLKKHPGEIDLLFLDVEMKGVNGIRTAEQIREFDTRIQIVFVTGFRDFVFEGYRVQAVDYLVKPVDADRLSSVLSRVRRQLEQVRQKQFVFQNGDGVYRLYQDEIQYFYSEKRKVVAVTREKELSFYAKLDEVEARVGRTFVRIHQRYLVNADAVSYISRSFFADSSIHACLFRSLLLRLLSFDFSLCIFLAQAGQYFDMPERGTYSTPHTVQFLGFNAVHRFVGVICNSPTKPMNL